MKDDRSVVGDSPRLGLAMIHSRYGWYQRSYLTALCEAFDVNLVTVFDDLDDDPMPPDLVERTARVALGMSGVRVRHYGPSSLMRLWRAVSRAVRASDVVLTSTQNPVHTKVAWAVAGLRRRPLCVVVEQWRPYPRQGALKSVYNAWSIRVMRSAARCFVHGEYAAAFARECGVRAERIRIYPHMNADVSGGVDRGQAANGFRFLYVGRLVPVKGLDVLIRAFARVREDGVPATLELAGDGPLHDELEALAASLDVEVGLTGRVAPADLPDAMASCDALILPSRRLEDAYEGWGLVVGEAASASKPLIVSTAVGSAPELVGDGDNGFVVQEGDVRALADAMIALARDPSAAAEMGRRSRERFERYCDPSVCVRLLREAV